MSKTLFWYIFRDLLKIFLMTSAVIAGIISFGGLLRPLSEYGLSGTQVTEMLGYLMPAAQTYSLPIAALFATTVVYGRLSADNEITACRASGISHMSLVLPAVVLGLVLALVSLVCLSYIVPRFTLRAERVAFDSLAEVVKKNIDRNHQIKVESYAIFADSATIIPHPDGRTDEEVVRLTNPMFCLYEDDEKLKYKVPIEFFMARQADVIIRQSESQVEFTAKLEDGSAFPRNFQGGSTGSVGVAQIGPFPLGSPIRENTKFMDIKQLKALHQDPTRSNEVKRLYTVITQQEQEAVYVQMLVDALKRDGRCVFESESEAYTLVLSGDARQSLKVGKSRLSASSGEAPALRGIQLIRERDGNRSEADEARAITIKVQADPSTDRVQIQFALEDVLIGADAVRPGKKSIPRYLSIPSPEALAAIEARGAEYYRDRSKARSDDGKKLFRRLMKLRNNIEGEIHGRMSFAVSCLILVVMGCGLGMMFRTGNYLTAFSISVIPALLTTALMITGQHSAENDSPNSLALGLSLIWLGNLIVLVLAMGLLIHLRRQ